MSHTKLSKPAAKYVHESVQPLSEELQRKLEDSGILFVETSQPGVELLGYVEASYTYFSQGGGTSSSTGRGEEPLTHEDSQDFNAYGLHLHLSKSLPQANTWAAGFHVGFAFGEKHPHARSHGDGHGHGHGTAPMQGESVSQLHEAYVEFRIPFGKGLDLGLGRWETFFGYEPHSRPANHYVTVGLLKHFLEPHFHTGVFVKYQLTDLVAVRLGLTNGWDHDDSFFFDGADFSKNVLGTIQVVNAERNARMELGVSYSADGEERFSKAELGEFDFGMHDPEIFHEDGNVWAFNWNGTWYPAAFREKLMLGFNVTAVHTDDNLQARVVKDHGHGHAELKTIRAQNTSTMWGMALYAKYEFSDVFSLAGRFEYLHADDSTLGIYDGWVTNADKKNASIDKQGILHTQTEVFSWTITASYTPVESLLLRAEYRINHISTNGGKGHVEFLGSSNFSHGFALYGAYLLW